MKTFVAILLLSSSAFANTLHCFKATTQVRIPTVPERICIESLRTENQVVTLTTESKTLSTALKWVDYEAQVGLAEFPLVNRRESCGTNIKTKLAVRFALTSDGEIQIGDSLQLEISYSYTNDNCHSQTKTGVINYVAD